MRSFGLFSLAALAAAEINIFESVQNSRVSALSPFEVTLSASEKPGYVQASIKNLGAVKAYFSKQQVLDEEKIVRRLHLFNGEEAAVPFLGIEPEFINELTDYVELAPGATTTNEIDVAAVHDLEAGAEYFAKAAGKMPYYLEGQTPADAKETLYESNTFSLKVDESTVKAALKGPVRNMKWTQGSCPDAALKKTISDIVPVALEMAKKASALAQDTTNSKAFTTWFKTDSPTTRSKVQGRYDAMVKALSSTTGPVRMGCNGSYCNVAKGAAAYAQPQTGEVSFCQVIKRYGTGVTKCNSPVFPGIMIHELSHLSIIYPPGTQDVVTGNPASAKMLTADRALANADQFNMFAQSAYLNTVC